MNLSPYKSVLVATDGSLSAVRAEAVAASITAGWGCRLFIVTISRDLPAAELRRLAHIEGDLGAARHTLVKSILESAKDRAKRAGVADVIALSDHGDPASTILAIAKREQVAMIVLGRRGVSALSEFLIGSVSKSVIDRASCAVTLVH